MFDALSDCLCRLETDYETALNQFTAPGGRAGHFGNVLVKVLPFDVIIIL